jgi:hypothetical protein
MTNTPTDQESQPNPPLQAASPVKDKNVLGIVAFIVAIVGFIFASIPGALIIGWILLPIAFILAIIALLLTGKGKKLALIGLIISIVGTIVGAVVFVSGVANAFDDAFSSGDTTVTAPEGQTGEIEKADEKQGTRANPYPIGSAITQGDWTVTINSVNLDATDEVTSANMFNDAPDAGSVYILVNITATYIGPDPDGESSWTSVNYVTAGGNTIDGSAKFISAPDSFDSLSTLYEGASITGNQALQVPADTAADGVLAVNLTLLGDKVFVAIK